MKVPLKWLSEFVPVTESVDRIAERLTMAGIEVGSIERIGASWQGVMVALVKEVLPHPNADRLRLVTVDFGSGTNTVVCGAPNVAAGQKVAYACLGAQLIDGHTGEPATLKAAKIRGVVSEGMVCSEKELGLSGDHTGTIELPPDAPVGMDLRDYLGDAVLDLELTPNRPDCLCVIGVAREVAALFDRPLTVPPVEYEDDGVPVESLMKVTIEDGNDCNRYCATVVCGLRVGPSPDWMQARLKACGVRPISNVVDITNYVMLEYGQPLHAFDYDEVAEHEIIVRRAHDGQVFTTLDGVERELSGEVLMIADAGRDVGIAGVMGGRNTEVSDSTTAILLEAATFNQAVIMRGSAYLGLRTEASIRIDKGLHPDLAYASVRRATQLLVELCGGSAAQGVYSAYPVPRAPRSVVLPHHEVKRLSGMDIPTAEGRAVLESLGFVWEATSEAGDTYQVPYWRGDVSGPADLVEDIVRIIGYDTIPVGIPRFSAGAVTVPAASWEFKSFLRDLFVGAGCQEVLTYSLTSTAKLRQLALSGGLGDNAVTIENPMSRESECLRTSLRASLLDVIARNRRRDEGPVRIFELSRVYLPRGEDLPDERETACILLTGPATDASWHGGARPVDFFDAKGLAELVLSRCGIRASFAPSQEEGLFPGRQAQILLGRDVLGVVGQLHPQVVQSFELNDPVFVLELDVAALLARATSIAAFRPLSRFPFSERDIAVVVDRDATYAGVERIVRESRLVSEVSLFDVYAGEQVPPGKKSFAVHIVYQADDHTLTDAEVNEAQERILARLGSKLGAVLRG
jgi:phenylalanyl-tRNA synthetase beta chain